MEPIKIEIAFKAENGTAEAVKAETAKESATASNAENGPENAKESAGELPAKELAWRIASEKARRLSKSRRSFTDLLSELCRDYADTYDAMKAGKAGLTECLVRNAANILCIEAAIRALKEDA